MKRLGSALFVLIAGTSTAATVAVRPLVVPAHGRSVAGITALDLASPDTEILRLEDQYRGVVVGPLPYAVAQTVLLGPWTFGTWERLDQEHLLWRAVVRSRGAQSLSFGFSRFELPEHAQLWIYSADFSARLGPFSGGDRPVGRPLWSSVVLGDEAILELVVDEAELGELDLELGQVMHGYRGFEHPGTGGGDSIDLALRADSGSCNVDVACPEAAPYGRQVRTVGRYTFTRSNRGFLCSGALINNTAEDGKPYFLTANHCVDSAPVAASVVVYWNFQNSTCRTPGTTAAGGTGDGSLSRKTGGSTLVATYAPSDATLLLLDEVPNQSWSPYWGGWDRGSGAPSRAVAVHHPAGQEKRLSLENDPLSVTSEGGSFSPGNGTHLRIEDWDIGTTEGGSSGSPLFNAAGRIVGQLHSGFAACGNDLSDWYGRFHTSWSGGGSPGSRLSDWLDPNGTGQTALDGFNGAALPPPPPGGPTAPSQLIATGISSTEIQLAWQDNSDDEHSFRIELAPDVGEFSEVGSVGANLTQAVVGGLSPASTFRFRVRARNASGRSAPSNVAFGSTQSALQIPAAPSALRASSPAAGELFLTWNDNSHNEDEVVVELTRRASRSGAQGVPFQVFEPDYAELVALPADSTSYLATGLEAGATFHLRVRARNAAGDSPASAEEVATTRENALPASCETPPGGLCLLQSRFRLEAFWSDQRNPGRTGDATAVPSTDQSGFFWFFRPQNIELVAKMVDARSLTDSFWLFYGSLSDVEYWLIVTDVSSGEVETTYNPPGNVCGGSNTMAFPTKVCPECVVPPAGTGIVKSMALASREELAARAGDCVPGDGTLCLLDGRFAISVDWHNQHPPGGDGTGKVVADPTGGDQTGFFWFFNQRNIELAVKILDGRLLNGHFWFFYGALSDVEYTITLRDTVTSNEVRFDNPPGNICGGAATDALPGE